MFSCSESVMWQKNKPQNTHLTHPESHNLDAVVIVIRSSSEDALERFLYDFEVLSSMHALIMSRQHLLRSVRNGDLHKIMIDNFWSRVLNGKKKIALAALLSSELSFSHQKLVEQERETLRTV